MRMRWIDCGLALVAAAVMAAMVLWPAGPRPEDLDLEVVSVRALPPEERYPQRVEVRVRWQWLRQPRTTQFRDVLAIAADRGRWVVLLPSSGVGTNDGLLSLLGQPQARWGNQVTLGPDGEHTFVLMGQDAGRFYEASAITLHIQYMHEPHERLGWPRHSWVRTVSGTYALDDGSPP